MKPFVLALILTAASGTSSAAEQLCPAEQHPMISEAVIVMRYAKCSLRRVRHEPELRGQYAERACKAGSGHRPSAGEDDLCAGGEGASEAGGAWISSILSRRQTQVSRNVRYGLKHPSGAYQLLVLCAAFFNALLTMKGSYVAKRSRNLILIISSVELFHVQHTDELFCQFGAPISTKCFI